MMNNPQPDGAPPQLVLLVDPDTATHDLYRTFLTPHRCIVEHAVDGREALAKAVADPPDMIVTEAWLPGIDGAALCQLLRSDPATRVVPIVVVTADARPEMRVRLLGCGANEVLVKPCLPDALWNELQTVSARRASNVVVRPPVEERLGRTLARQHRRYDTTTPPLAPPRLHCPVCDATLEYERSHVGGVSAKFSEQWDQYECPQGCGAFEYRHRTRKVSRRAA
jgi:CheY-like chemotaxis protein